jgi:hypothetical protein
MSPVERLEAVHVQMRELTRELVKPWRGIDVEAVNRKVQTRLAQIWHPHEASTAGKSRCCV